ncbi:MAG: rhodanese-like domain-containing protein [Reyranellaceae bacterium]
MSVATVDPRQAQRLVEQGAVLVDIREPGEHARERIPGARHNPLSRLAPLDPCGARAVIYHCRSGARTAAHAERLQALADCPCYLLGGGLQAWKQAGLPVAGASRGASLLERLIGLLPWTRRGRGALPPPA